MGNRDSRGLIGHAVHLLVVDDLNQLDLPDLFRLLTEGTGFVRALDAAFREDLGEVGDVTTTSLIDAKSIGAGTIVARGAGVIAGLTLVDQLAHRLDATLSIEPASSDGEGCESGDALGVVRGPLRSLLALERPMLNYLGHLSGIATMTRAFVDAVAGTGTVICDTRKTTPGLRRLEKYAVRCGGGTLHRLGLDDAALYKDNHLAALNADRWDDQLASAIRIARANHTLTFVEVEVDEIAQLERLLEMPSDLIDIVLLDNMAPDDLRAAVALRDESHPALKLEASGGVTLATVRAIAETGVDRISVGAITHSAPWLDIGLDIA